MGRLFSLILFLIGAGFVVMAFLFPLWICPIGNYKYENDTAKAEVAFDIQGKCEESVAGITTKSYYKVEDGKVKLDSAITEIVAFVDAYDVKNFFTISKGDNNYTNIIAIIITGVFGLIGLAGLVGVVRK